jgi:iron(III) transport system substrate-binding protein
MAVNTKQVPASDVPQTYDDLLDPKWKGKMAWRAGAESGDQLFVTNALTSRGDKEGEAYLKKLSGNDIVNYSGSARALVDRVGQGEYPLALNIFAHHPIIAAEKGAPLDVKMLEPVPTLVNEVVLVKGAPHPHAAMLLIDFMLGLDGQNVLKDAQYFPPHPKVDPAENLHRVVPRLAKLKENVVSPVVLFDYKEKANAILKAYFK